MWPHVYSSRCTSFVELRTFAESGTGDDFGEEGPASSSGVGSTVGSTTASSFDSTSTGGGFFRSRGGGGVFRISNTACNRVAIIKRTNNLTLMERVVMLIR